MDEALPVLSFLLPFDCPTDPHYSEGCFYVPGEGFRSWREMEHERMPREGLWRLNDDNAILLQRLGRLQPELQGWFRRAHAEVLPLRRNHPKQQRIFSVNVAFAILYDWWTRLAIALTFGHDPLDLNYNIIRAFEAVQAFEAVIAGFRLTK